MSIAKGIAPSTFPATLSLRQISKSQQFKDLEILTERSVRSFETDGCRWNVETRARREESNSDVRDDIFASLTLVEGTASDVSFVASFAFNEWNPENFVLVPGVIYNGNRFPCKHQDYPPILDDIADMGPQCLPFITDVPRLSYDSGPSSFSLLAGAMSIPAVGIFDSCSGRGRLFQFKPVTNSGECGIEFIENASRDAAVLRIFSPGARIGTRYTMCTTTTPSHDTGASLAVGDQLSIRITSIEFACRDVTFLFQKLLTERQGLCRKPTLIHSLPFSAAWSILEGKYNRDNWNEEDGYYRVGMGENRFQDFQIGWVGGLMSTLPLLQNGSCLSRERASSTLDFVLRKGGVSRSGFFHGLYHQGRWSGDGFDIAPPDPRSANNDGRNRYHLLRKSADALYFILKQIPVAAGNDPSWNPPISWLDGCRKCATAFSDLWKRYGQVGQFVDIDTGELIIGGSSSAGILPAALVWASKTFEDTSYLRLAIDIGKYFEQSFINKGISTGGPGEILQCPDSESTAGLLESFVTLWEATSDLKWLWAAEKAAAQLATWQMSYDYPFPKETEFGRLGIRSAGSIFANSQNGHSAPGICTLSGDSLLKLFRATGKQIYAQLLTELSHNLTQYLSTSTKPIHDPTGRPLPPGWMNERVNTSDWDNNLGGVFYGSTWAEVAMMLTCVQVPSVYVRSDTDEVAVFDHINVERIEDRGCLQGLHVFNPTCYEAAFHILIENVSQARLPLELSINSNIKTCKVPAKSGVKFMLTES